MDELTLDQLIERIKDPDAQVRAKAWQAAGPIGAKAVEPLAAVMKHDDFEVARAAKRGLWVVVRYAGRPGNDEAKKAVEAKLCDLLIDDERDSIRREVLWMLSEIGGDVAVEAIREIPNILFNRDLREDARCALQRIPTDYAVQTLEDGLEEAPDDYKPAIAQSLRVRGVEVSDIPSEKLIPTKQTKVEPVGR